MGKSIIHQKVQATHAHTHAHTTTTITTINNKQAKKETELLAAIQGLRRREEQNPAEAQARVRRLIGELEAAKGIPRPARAPQVNGKWRLLYTSSDGTASPIQRGFVGSSAVTVYQLIDLEAASSPEPTVTNLVDFGK
jgi:hypothetical protein